MLASYFKFFINFMSYVELIAFDIVKFNNCALLTYQSREQRKIEAIEKTFARIEQSRNRQKGIRQSTDKQEEDEESKPAAVSGVVIIVMLINCTA